MGSALKLCATDLMFLLSRRILILLVHVYSGLNYGKSFGHTDWIGLGWITCRWIGLSQDKNGPTSNSAVTHHCHYLASSEWNRTNWTRVL